MRTNREAASYTTMPIDGLFYLSLGGPHGNRAVALHKDASGSAGARGDMNEMAPVDQSTVEIDLETAQRNATAGA